MYTLHHQAQRAPALARRPMIRLSSLAWSGWHPARSTGSTSCSRITTSPAVGYCVRTAAACWYDGDRERLEVRQAEKIALVDAA